MYLLFKDNFNIQYLVLSRPTRQLGFVLSVHS